jgi:hypothetical protein
MDPQVFRSRIDPLLAALVFVPVLVVCGVVLQRAMARGQPPSGVTLATLVLSIGLVVWIFTTTSYRFVDRDLLVQSGPLRVRIPVAQIRRVTRTRSVLSAPALSLQRLEIEYDTHSVVVISPRDETGFLAALKVKVPSAELPSGK